MVRPVVLALPRGGIPIGLEVAKALHAPLDLLMVRKIGVPWQPELAAAAIVDGPAHTTVLNEDVMAMTGLRLTNLQPTIDRELAEIDRRRALYLDATRRTPIPVTGRSVIIVDDGVATGTTLRAAIRALRTRSPREIIVAVPVAPADAVDALREEVDHVVCLAHPDPFYAIGLHYADFHPLEDAEVQQLLARAPRETAGATGGPSQSDQAPGRP
jgi:putative phosphoribosyl transferase